jgi:hypothetical protein
MHVKNDSDIFTIDMSTEDGLKDNSVLDRLYGDNLDAVDHWGVPTEDISVGRYILVSLKEMDDREWRWKSIIVFRVDNISGHIDETEYNEDLWFITGLDNVVGYPMFAHSKGSDDITTLDGDARESFSEHDGGGRGTYSVDSVDRAPLVRGYENMSDKELLAKTDEVLKLRAKINSLNKTTTVFIKKKKHGKEM